DGALLSGPEVPLLHCQAPSVEVADTTGAGDAFTGTFLARRLAGDDPATAVQAALAAAAQVVAAIGARPWT
ncbi:MAG TPA: PfkB family carbohydrate kinase, partial [Acidimicrobiales bacterium]|nr:PfkB family carbohydrate kinase [Acidimicrobiales bacterium]